jgi:hypothetical protein
MYESRCLRCCCGPFKDQACGWPPKTVRSLIALIFAFAAVLVEGFLVVYFALNDENNSAIVVAAALLSEFSAIGGFYYGQRSAKKGSTDLADVPPPLPPLPPLEDVNIVNPNPVNSEDVPFEGRIVAGDSNV